jgi:hypothetical protein
MSNDITACNAPFKDPCMVKESPSSRYMPVSLAMTITLLPTSQGTTLAILVVTLFLLKLTVKVAVWLPMLATNKLLILTLVPLLAAFDTIVTFVVVTSNANVFPMTVVMLNRLGAAMCYPTNKLFMAIFIQRYVKLLLS